MNHDTNHIDSKTTRGPPRDLWCDINNKDKYTKEAKYSIPTYTPTTIKVITDPGNIKTIDYTIQDDNDDNDDEDTDSGADSDATSNDLASSNDEEMSTADDYRHNRQFRRDSSNYDVVALGSKSNNDRGYKSRKRTRDLSERDPDEKILKLMNSNIDEIVDHMYKTVNSLRELLNIAKDRIGKINSTSHNIEKTITEIKQTLPQKKRRDYLCKK